MAPIFEIIKKRSTFVHIRNNGKLIRGESFNLQILKDTKLDDETLVGLTATKKLGTAIKRNKAKRLMRELARKVIVKYGKINCYYVIVAKSSIFQTPFSVLEKELKKMVS